MPRFYVDNSMMEGYKKCPRFYYLRYFRHWEADAISKAILFGASWHAAMAVIWQGFKKLPFDKLIRAAYTAFEHKWIEERGPKLPLDLQQIEQWEPRTPMTAAEMLVNYVNDRRSILEKAKVLTIEQPFAVPIFSDRDDVWFIGRKDARIFLNQYIIIEHKSTTEYKIDGGFKQSYLEQWALASQLKGYLFSDRVSEKKPADMIWVDAALVHKKVHDKFKFIPISVALEAMEDWLWETRDWTQRIMSETDRLADAKPKATHMTSFPKNDWSCEGKYGRCQFFDVCRSIPNPQREKAPPQGFRERKWEPFEVLHLDKIMER